MMHFPHGTPVYLTEDVRRIEALAAAGAEPPQLMERAGLAAAELARELAGGSGKPIVVFAGPGNNGGDAFVLARHLKSWWFDVSVHFTGDAQKLSHDAAAAYAAWQEAGGTLANDTGPLRGCALVVDGLFGIGLQRELTGRYAELVSMINQTAVPVLALDVPSGLESDSGRILGCAVRASHTITFIGVKPGLLTLNGPDQSGALHLASLGLAAAAFVPPAGSVIGAGVLRQTIPPRSLNSHKGSFGSVAIIGGALGMVGAALLAGRATLKLGAGRVYVGLLDEHALPVDPVQPELMVRSADAALELDQVTVLAVGPGLGVSAQSTALVAKALASTLPLVLDADALNLIATQESLSTALSMRKAATVLTPHPAEAARLGGVSTAEIQRDRVKAALRLAMQHRCGIVLKGTGSVCAWPDGKWAINTSGNPGMSSAGMGDVLTGIVAALLAQGATPEAALTAGVYLHGAAADAAVASGHGPAGLAASEIIDPARDILNREVMSKASTVRS
jgi:ADP-dependent NAD(P)H-hydrate dehydratase / NAD(P)H-hydrate epimerase